MICSLRLGEDGGNVKHPSAQTLQPGQKPQRVKRPGLPKHLEVYLIRIRNLILFFILVAGSFISGCGGSEDFTGIQNVQNVFGNLSGDVGRIRLDTTLQQQVLAQASLESSTVVPAVVTDFRFSGFTSEGTQILAVVKPKAGSVPLNSVPVEVTNLRIELLAGGLAIGGASLPVTVTTATEPFVITNPTYFLLGGNAPVYGSFILNDGNQQVPPNQVIRFPEVIASVGVTEVGETGIYEVSTEGDYLVSYNFTGFGSGYVFNVLAANVQNTVLDTLNLGNFVDDPSYQFVVSLNPAQGGRSRVRLSTNSNGGGITQGTFTIVRIGPSTNSDLPDLLPDNGGGNG